MLLFDESNNVKAWEN